MWKRKLKAKNTSQKKIEITERDMVRIVTDNCYDTIETISEELGKMLLKRMDLLSDYEEQSVDYWMKDAVKQCIDKVNKQYHKIGINVKNKIKEDKLWKK